MSAVDTPSTTNNNNNNNNNNHHRRRRVLPTKRKLEDCDHSTSSSHHHHHHHKAPFHASAPKAHVQFFVRPITGGKTLILRANVWDTVEIIHRKIEVITGVPMAEQRLIYMGKQLRWEETLQQCRVQDDAGLQLVARMRSTDHPRAWRVISDMVYVICKLCRTVDSNPVNADVSAAAAGLVSPLPVIDCRIVKVKLEQFMALPLDKKSKERGFGNSLCNRGDYYKVFMDACAPQALVMMYRSVEKRNQDCADECIRCFVSFVKDLGLGGTVGESGYCAVMVLEFCRLLKMLAGGDDALYVFCRSALGMMLEKVELVSRPREYYGENTVIAVQDLFPYLNEIGEGLVDDLVQSAEFGSGSGPSLRDVCDFSAFLKPLLCFIEREFAAMAASFGSINVLGDEAACLYNLFTKMLALIDKCLGKMKGSFDMKTKKEVEAYYQSGWPHYLAILKDLSSIAVIYPGTKSRFWAIMRKNKVVVCSLVLLCANRINDHGWILKQKDVLDFESRRHLAMLMFPEVKEDYEELHEMLIDRSQLLAESFEYISNAQPSALHAGLFMEFKNEEATGPGVLREWFCMVTQAIFDPQNALFVACPLDRRRFYPNPASKVDPLHIRYFRFAGRVIALALMHKIQIGVVLDRVFFLQLAGRCVSVEDIKNADPCLYNSCKQILEMDPEFVDSDGLGLTFVTEVEVLGSRKVVELCDGGKSIVLNSKNRKEYVHLIVQQHFVISISEQVLSFAKGFADILRDTNLRTAFFESLEPEELDWMLHGSKTEEICVEDWKAHTEYNGYTNSDPQIIWFWEVVGQLNVEQKKTLLFFWTSVKYLPVEGFHGLASKLFIYKSLEPEDRLPSSHTCFYRLCIPPYPTKAIMLDRLQVITQEHIGCSFGTW